MDPPEQLKDAGLRRTPARIALLGLLLRSERPLAHHEIVAEPAASELDRVTIYRTLSALQEAGLVHGIQGTDGVWRFRANARDVAGCPGDHPHFLCRSCGRMSCLAAQAMPWVEVPPGARVEGKQFLVFGLCTDCAASSGARR